MSDENRDADTGQFTSSSEGLYGQQALEAENGYKPMTVANPVKDAPDDFSVSEREAADAYASVDEESPVIPIEYFDVADGSPRDPKETISLEQAAHDYSNWESSKANDAALSVSKDFSNAIDDLRSEVAQDPKLSEHYGLEKTGDAAKPAELIASEESAPKAASVDGLDPEVERALKNPQVRQAIEQEVAETYKVREAYSTSLQQGNQMLQGVVAALAPGLQSVPIEQWGQAIVALAQTDPVRAELVADSLSKWNNIALAQQQDQQRQQFASKQQFDNYAKAEDARFREMMGNDRGKIEAAALQVVDYAKELGIDRETFVEMLATQPVMRHSAFQKMMCDAAEFRALKNTDWKARASKAPPPTVQRPGIPQPRQSIDTELESKFQRNPSLKNASALYAAKKARG